METYRIWLMRTYGNMGSAILVKARSSKEAKTKAVELGYGENQISGIEYIGK